MKKAITTIFKEVKNISISSTWDVKGLNKYIGYIKKCLDELYKHEASLFTNNLCERCLVFRFAYYLQNYFGREYFVDCDYNSSCYYDPITKEWKRRNGKPIPDQKRGEIKKRFIDIIVHKRGFDNSDLICFEIKKWNNITKDGIKKDKNNLRILTSQFGYSFGFHLFFGKTKDKTKIRIFNKGKFVKSLGINDLQGYVE
jgi:hypothetical protein